MCALMRRMTQAKPSEITTFTNCFRRISEEFGIRNKTYILLLLWLRYLSILLNKRFYWSALTFIMWSNAVVPRWRTCLVDFLKLFRSGKRHKPFLANSSEPPATQTATWVSNCIHYRRRRRRRRRRMTQDSRFKSIYSTMYRHQSYKSTEQCENKSNISFIIMATRWYLCFVAQR